MPLTAAPASPRSCHEPSGVVLAGEGALGGRFHRASAPDLHMGRMDAAYVAERNLRLHADRPEGHAIGGWNVAPRHGRRRGIGLHASDHDLLMRW